MHLHNEKLEMVPDTFGPASIVLPNINKTLKNKNFLSQAVIIKLSLSN